MEDNQIIQHATHPDMADIHPDAIPLKYMMTASSNTREYRVPATSTVTTGANPGKISFNNIKLNPGEALDRTVMVEFIIQAQVEATDATAAQAAVAKLSGLALAAYPINRALTDLNVRLNGNGKSVQPWEYVGAFNHTHDSIEYRRLNSFPSQPDSYNNIRAMELTSGARVTKVGVLSNATYNIGTDPVVEIEASPDSPFAGYSSGYDQPRCKFPVESITVTAADGTDPTRVTVQWKVQEPLLHPFFRTNEFKSVLSRVSSLDVDLTFGDLHSCLVLSQAQLKAFNDLGTSAATENFSLSNFGNAATPEVTFVVGSAHLLYRMYMPTVQVPQVLSIPYMEPVVNREPIPAIAAIGDSVTVNTRSYQLSQVPHRIMLFARPRGQFTGATSPEAFLRIKKLQFRTNGDSGGLSGSGPAQLFQISTRNGLNMTWNKFYRDIGSIVVLDLEKGDIGGFVPGTRESFNFDITAEFTNTQFNALPCLGSPHLTTSGTTGLVNNWDFYIISFMDSKMILDGTNCTLVNGENQELVRQVLAERPVHLVGDQLSGPMVGRGVLVGGSWKGFTRFLGKAISGVSDVLGLGKQAMGVVGQARGMLGRGVGDPQAYPGPYGGGLRILG